MAERRDVGVFGRAAARLMNALTLRSQGYELPFYEEFFRSLGVLGYLKFVGNLAKISELLIARYGDRDAQILIGLAAMWNGCDFCSVGHVFAANLYHFRQEDRLLPLDEKAMPELTRMPDGDGIARISEIFGEPQYERLRGLIAREHALKAGRAQGAGDDDGYLRGCLAAWDLINECSIVAVYDEIPPLAPIAKERALRDRYLAARRDPQKP